MKRWKVGILLFDDAEVLDFAGPFEVFAVTSVKQNEGELYSPFEVTTISETGQMITARNGLKVQPDYSFGSAPAYDLLVIPGGMGTRGLVHNKAVVAWIAERFAEVLGWNESNVPEFTFRKGVRFVFTTDG